MASCFNQLDIHTIRSYFPALQRVWEGHPLIYLDSAATALKPTAVIDAVADFDRTLGATVNRGVYSLAQEATAKYDHARTIIQRFIHAEKAEEIIFTRGTTAALNLVAESFARTFCQPGDIILLTEIEHHSNLIPWQMVAKRYGLQLQFLKVNDQAELILDGPLDPKVKIVSVAHISNVFGTSHCIRQLADMAHQVGAVICVDGAQSVAHTPIDVKELDIDFFAFSGHKLYGPTGVGVLYGKKHLLEQMEPIEGGGDMLLSATLSSFTPATLPYKFEAGTPMIAQAIGLAAAIEFINTIGLEAIQAHEAALMQHSIEQLSTIEQLRWVGQPAHRGAIGSFIIEDVHPLDLISLLDCRSIALRTGHHCSQPAMQRFGITSSCRFSLGMYNTHDEIDAFIYHLKEILTLL